MVKPALAPGRGVAAQRGGTQGSYSASHGLALIRNVTITLDIDPAPTMVHGDRVQLQRVVLNLL